MRPQGGTRRTAPAASERHCERAECGPRPSERKRRRPPTRGTLLAVGGEDPRGMDAAGSRTVLQPGQAGRMGSGGLIFVEWDLVCKAQ